MDEGEKTRVWATAPKREREKRYGSYMEYTCLVNIIMFQGTLKLGIIIGNYT